MFARLRHQSWQHSHLPTTVPDHTGSPGPNDRQSKNHIHSQLWHLVVSRVVTVSEEHIASKFRCPVSSEAFRSTLNINLKNSLRKATRNLNCMKFSSRSETSLYNSLHHNQQFRTFRVSREGKASRIKLNKTHTLITDNMARQVLNLCSGLSGLMLGKAERRRQRL